MLLALIQCILRYLNYREIFQPICKEWVEEVNRIPDIKVLRTRMAPYIWKWGILHNHTKMLEFFYSLNIKNHYIAVLNIGFQQLGKYGNVELISRFEEYEEKYPSEKYPSDRLDKYEIPSEIRLGHCNPSRCPSFPEWTLQGALSTHNQPVIDWLASKFNIDWNDHMDLMKSIVEGICKGTHLDLFIKHVFPFLERKHILFSRIMTILNRNNNVSLLNSIISYLDSICEKDMGKDIRKNGMLEYHLPSLSITIDNVIYNKIKKIYVFNDIYRYQRRYSIYHKEDYFQPLPVNINLFNGIVGNYSHKKIIEMVEKCPYENSYHLAICGALMEGNLLLVDHLKHHFKGSPKYHTPLASNPSNPSKFPLEYKDRRGHRRWISSSKDQVRYQRKRVNRHTKKEKRA